MNRWRALPLVALAAGVALASISPITHGYCVSEGRYLSDDELIASVISQDWKIMVHKFNMEFKTEREYSDSSSFLTSNEHTKNVSGRQFNGWLDTDETFGTPPHYITDFWCLQGFSYNFVLWAARLQICRQPSR